MVSIGSNRANGDYNHYRINVPQRIEPPKDLNTPARREGGKAVKGGADDPDGAGQPEPATETADALADIAKNLGSLAVSKKQARHHAAPSPDSAAAEQCGVGGRRA